MTEPRIKVKETQMYCSDYFEGKFEDIIASLQERIDEGWEGIEEYWEQYADCPYYRLYKHREETDKEYEKRMKQLERQKEQKLKEKEKRRKQYEKLKKEFGDD